MGSEKKKKKKKKSGSRREDRVEKRRIPHARSKPKNITYHTIRPSSLSTENVCEWRFRSPPVASKLSNRHGGPFSANVQFRKINTDYRPNPIPGQIDNVAVGDIRTADMKRQYNGIVRADDW